MKRVWLNKELVKGKLAISAQNRGLTLGDGLFETLAVHDDVALWQTEHLQRMQDAALELGIPFPENQIKNAIATLIHHCKGHHVLRLTLTRGEGGRGLAGDIAKPTLIGSLQPFDVALRFQPVSLGTSSLRRNLHSPTARLKTLSYLDNILAAREAHAKGFDDALMLNTAGRVACTTIGNVFLEVEGGLLTPSLPEAILPGIMRATVIRLAKQAGMKVSERHVKSADIAKADAMFMTNSLRFVRNVTTCDGKRFSTRSKRLDIIMRELAKAEQEQIILK